MVNESGQIYTIEAISAGILMLFTVYLVLNSTNLFTPGDSHINDMQLQQIGNDALVMMDTPGSFDMKADPSNLSRYLSSDLTNPINSDRFYQELRSTLNQRTAKSDNIRMNAVVFYRNTSTNSVDPGYEIPGGDPYYRENSVVARRWVYTVQPQSFGGDNRNQTVLLEVQIWRP